MSAEPGVSIPDLVAPLRYLTSIRIGWVWVLPRMGWHMGLTTIIDHPLFG